MTDVQHTPTTEDEPRSKRMVVGGIAVVGAAALLAACGDTDDDQAATGSTTPSSAGGASTTAGSPVNGDAQIAVTAAGLEFLAVDTYTKALQAAQSGALGAVPPAVATFVQTAMAHHKQALEGWNTIITSGGGQAVNAPPAQLASTVQQQLGQAKTVGDAAKIALTLEQTAADTYLAVIPKLQSKEAITRAGALQSVDQEHVAILLFVLGQYPVPEVFQKTDNAFSG